MPQLTTEHLETTEKRIRTANLRAQREYLMEQVVEEAVSWRKAMLAVPNSGDNRVQWQEFTVTEDALTQAVDNLIEFEQDNQILRD